MIIAGMATIKGREAMCRRAIQSLLPQVDELWVSSPNPSELVNSDATWLDEAIRKKKLNIRESRGKFHGDSRKFRVLSEALLTYSSPVGYSLMTVDDDIIYPDDYVATLLGCLDANPGSVVGVHGRQIESKSMESFYRDTKTIDFRAEVAELAQVDFVGTGTCMWGAQRLSPHNISSGMLLENMADVLLAIMCEQRNIPRYIVPRKAGWMTDMHENMVGTIWANDVTADRCQTEIVNRSIQQGLFR